MDWECVIYLPWPSRDTLDVVISGDCSSVMSNRYVSDHRLCDHLGRMSEDHYAVSFIATIAKPDPVQKKIYFWKLRTIDAEDFKHCITESPLQHPPGRTVNELVSVYNDILLSLVNMHAPLRPKTITFRPSYLWYTHEVHRAKHLRHKLEYKWHQTRLVNNFLLLTKNQQEWKALPQWS